MYESTFNTRSNLEKITPKQSSIFNGIKELPNQSRQNNLGGKVLERLEAVMPSLREKAKKNIEQLTVNALGQSTFQSVCEYIVSKAKAITSSGTSGIQKKVVSSVTDTMKYTNKLLIELNNVQNPNGIGIGTNVSTGDQTSTQSNNRAGLNNLSTNATRLSEGFQYVECINPLYNLSEGEYQSTFKKNMKATLLTIVTFVITMLLTNIIRIYLGGSPGGDFPSGWQHGLFTFFSSLILAPIIEEPAKLIAIKGGYGKNFYFAFNFLEFGGYLLMFLMTGGSGLGVFIILRTICAIFHAITMRIMGSGNKGAVKSTIKLAICILLHFAFNALFIKYAGLIGGMAASKVLMFAMGFFGAAFGIFKVFKRKEGNI